jgi:hypothetical protein
MIKPIAYFVIGLFAGLIVSALQEAIERIEALENAQCKYL